MNKFEFTCTCTCTCMRMHMHVHVNVCLPMFPQKLLNHKWCIEVLTPIISVPNRWASLGSARSVEQKLCLLVLWRLTWSWHMGTCSCFRPTVPYRPIANLEVMAPSKFLATNRSTKGNCGIGSVDLRRAMCETRGTSSSSGHATSASRPMAH